MRAYVDAQLRLILEDKALRSSVIGVLLVFASIFSLVPTAPGIDRGWFFIVPVAISSVAAGFREGLMVAFISSALCALYSGAGAGEFVTPDLVSLVSTRFTLYGLSAAVLGVFADTYRGVQVDLREKASLDPLTQVSNVARFYDEMGLLEKARVSSFALLLVDMDDLKTINDRYGHQTGSLAIRSVANALKGVVRGGDCVARFGGDEFVVILRDADRAGAQIVVNRLRDSLAGERLAGGNNSISVSAGVALFGEDGTSSEELLARADAAMYLDKEKRKAALSG
jgi:diguanylate cyclase (GGDEF)-like protein